MESLTLVTKEISDDPRILKELISAHRYLAELKGVAHSLPNQKILLSTLTLQEGKDSSAIENIITTHDSLFKYQIQPDPQDVFNKEIYNYSKALQEGWKTVQSAQGISCNTIVKVHGFIEPKKSGFRKIPGTVIKNIATNEIKYTPPSPEKIPKLMEQLEHFINAKNSMDPLVKMAIAHHYFESIHPFYDGNGRTGRILNILYLLLNDLLDSPILYLSRYILRHKSDYYRLLQQVREKEDWIDWIVYMLKAISVTSQETMELIKKIKDLFMEYKQTIRSNYKFYSHDLINNIFLYPYTKVKFLEKNMEVSRVTASRYLDELVKGKILYKGKLGREAYYVNIKLFNLLKDT